MNTEWKPIPASLYDLILTGDLEALLWQLKGVREAEEIRMALYNARKAILDAEEHSDCTPAPTSHPIPTGATGEAVKRLRDAIEGECGGNWISEKQAAAVLAHLGISAPAAGDALGDPALQKLFGEAITGALGFGAQGVNPPPVGHWLEPFWKMARADAALVAGLALLDHQLLRDVLGYVEDAGPADVWGAAQSWMSLRDAAIAQQKGEA